MKTGDLVKEIYHGAVGIIFETNPDFDMMKVMFFDGTRRWLRRDSLRKAVCE